jgi:hypothetical protein
MLFFKGSLARILHLRWLEKGVGFMMTATQSRLLGEVLKDMGYINEGQLLQALRIKEQYPQRMTGRILVDLGYATELQVFQAIEAQWQDWMKGNF